MKLRLLISVAVIVLFASPAVAGGGELVFVSGKVWTTPPGKSEQVATKGTKVAPGTKIRTGPEGRAEVKFASGSILD